MSQQYSPQAVSAITDLQILLNQPQEEATNTFYKLFYAVTRTGYLASSEQTELVLKQVLDVLSTTLTASVEQPIGLPIEVTKETIDALVKQAVNKGLADETKTVEIPTIANKLLVRSKSRKRPNTTEQLALKNNIIQTFELNSDREFTVKDLVSYFNANYEQVYKILSKLVYDLVIVKEPYNKKSFHYKLTETPMSRIEQAPVMQVDPFASIDVILEQEEQ